MSNTYLGAGVVVGGEEGEVKVVGGEEGEVKGVMDRVVDWVVDWVVQGVVEWVVDWVVREGQLSCSNRTEDLPPNLSMNPSA